MQNNQKNLFPFNIYFNHGIHSHFSRARQGKIRGRESNAPYISLADIKTIQINRNLWHLFNLPISKPHTQKKRNNISQEKEKKKFIRYLCDASV